MADEHDEEPLDVVIRHEIDTTVSAANAGVVEGQAPFWFIPAYESYRPHDEWVASGVDQVMGVLPLLYMYYVGVDTKALPAAYMRKLAMTELVDCPKAIPTAFYAAIKNTKDARGRLRSLHAFYMYTRRVHSSERF